MKELARKYHEVDKLRIGYVKIALGKSRTRKN